ncbi:MAG: ATP-binding protein [Myxococcota bacterium]
MPVESPSPSLTGGSSLADQALANLVDQFARPLDFLRELAQNAIDAGTPRIDVYVAFTPPRPGEPEGVLRIGMDDYGEGMDEDTIDNQLTRLFSSTKEHDLTKIGKFGIGFTSIFAIRPEAVLLRTGRHGEYWELLFHPDRTFDKVRITEPVKGTQISLFKRTKPGDVDRFVQELRFVLGYWCEHSETPITFSDRTHEAPRRDDDAEDPFAAFDEPGGDPMSPAATERVDRALTLDLPMEIRHTEPGLEVVIGFADPPRYGFYNGGLTLLNTQSPQVLGAYAPQLAHTTFKVKYDRLEHTYPRQRPVGRELARGHGGRPSGPPGAAPAPARRGRARGARGRRPRAAAAPPGPRLRRGRRRALPPPLRDPPAFRDVNGRLHTVGTVRSQEAKLGCVLVGGGAPRCRRRSASSGSSSCRTRPRPASCCSPPKSLSCSSSSAASSRSGAPRSSSSRPRSWRPRRSIRRQAPPAPAHRGVARPRRGAAGGGAGRSPRLPLGPRPHRLAQPARRAGRRLRRHGSGPRRGPRAQRPRRRPRLPAAGALAVRAARVPELALPPRQPAPPAVPGAAARLGRRPRRRRLRPRLRAAARRGHRGEERALPHARGRPRGGDGGRSPVSDTLDALLQRSRAPGRFVERRSFTLSREKAIAKQREFALRHPRQYLLELVQGAVFAGATYMAIDTRPESLLVAWVGGQSMQSRELENLFDYLFADRGQRQWRHLVQIAIGVNALLQRQPRVLRIESGDGTKAFRMDLDPSGRATIGQPTESIQGTYLFAEYTVGWLSRFTSSGVSEEQQLVEERCLYTPIPILLNGMAPFGYRGSRHIAVFGARSWEPFDQDGRRGVIAIHASPDGPRGFRIVVGGVWITTLTLDDMADVPLYGVICDDNLRKTADQSDIVQDRRFAEMLHAVQPVATRLMHRVRGPSYTPPALAPLPPPEADQPAAPAQPEVERVEAEPLPDPIPMLAPRNPTTLEQLRQRVDAPVFTVLPAIAPTLAGPVASPDRFPWKVLLLTEGQSLTLQAEIPDLTVHRLTSKADVDFVRRVVGRRIRTREVTTRVGDSRVVLQLFLDGPLPDWGPGMPFCVTGPMGIVEYGGIEPHGRVSVSGTRTATRDRTLALPLSLPSVALTVHVQSGTHLTEAHARGALDAAWQLAIGDGEPHGPLLAYLLGAMGVPQFVHHPSEVGPGHVGTEMSLPLGWSLSLRTAALCQGADAPVTLARLEGLLGTDEAVAVPDLAALLALDPLERRLGYGHLTHPELEVRPLFGAGRFGSRWVWIERADVWGSPALEQVVWVGATFAPRDHDQQVQAGIRPPPELVGASRAPIDEGDPSWAEGLRTLFAGLQRVEAEQRWSAFASGSVTPGRAEGMGRLALIHLAVFLGQDHQPLLVPSDGGGRRSPREIREHPAARVVARRGVRLAEPWTFALTRDELQAVSHPPGATVQRPRLRYDDTPDVWRTLSETDQGWLVRQQIHQAGLRGWLGLRCPYDGTASVLLHHRRAHRPVRPRAQRALPRPLLWSDDGAPADERAAPRGAAGGAAAVPGGSCRCSTAAGVGARARRPRLRPALRAARLAPRPGAAGHRPRARQAHRAAPGGQARWRPRRVVDRAGSAAARGRRDRPRRARARRRGAGVHRSSACVVGTEAAEAVRPLRGARVLAPCRPSNWWCGSRR